MSIMRHGAKLSSEKTEVEGQMRSQMVGAIARHPGIESCDFSTSAVAESARALEGTQYLTEVSMTATIFDCNDGGRLCNDKENSSFSCKRSPFLCTEQANPTPCFDFDLTRLRDGNRYNNIYPYVLA